MKEDSDKKNTIKELIVKIHNESKQAEINLQTIFPS